VEVLIPDSAHGTNPASVVMAGMKPVTIESGADGRLDPARLAGMVNERTAGIMITNPNTLGLFETDIVEVARIIHEAGGRLYMDGANMNAILGKARPAAMGFDVVHFNLHKTFSTPHGGGGPGSGPICVTEELAPFLPGPVIACNDGVFSLEDGDNPDRPSVHSYFGNVGVCLRALAYILRLGGDGLTRVAELAVLNANYLQHQLADVFTVPHKDGFLHEFIASASDWKQQYGVRALDIAKRMLDYGMHAPTVYFPLIVEEAMMIEPTETESLEDLEGFIRIMRKIREEAASDPDLLHNAPTGTPVSRMDETSAARNPDLRWMGPCNCG
jgi:glycine cleavage system P protein (glycine dehydrogenase) subunit 2